MAALYLLAFAFVTTLLGVSAQYVPCYGTPRPYVPCVPRPDPSYYYNDANALLLLSKAIEGSSVSGSNDINSSDLINKLLNALLYVTVPQPCSNTTPTPTPTPSSSNTDPLIGLQILNGKDLLRLALAGTDVLDLDIGKGGGALTNVVDTLI